MSKKQNVVLVFVSLLCLSFIFQFSPAAADSPREILRLGRGTANTLDWRPDGKVLAVGGGTGIWLYDENFEPLTHFENSNVDAVRWNPSGDKLAFADDTGVHIWAITGDAKSGGELLNIESADISSLAWRPDGSQLAVGSNNGVKVWNINDGEIARSFSINGYSVAWKPDGQQFGIADGDGITIFNSTNWQILRHITDKQASSYVSWSPNGETIATGCYDDDKFYDFDGVCLWEAETGTFIDSQELAGFVWNPDGSEYVYFGSDGFENVQSWIEILSWPSRTSQVRIGYGAQLHKVIWHPHTKRLTGLTFDGRIIEWDTQADQIIFEGELHTADVQALTWSPDNRKIAATRGSVLSIWSLENQQEGLVSEPLFSFDERAGTYGSADVEVRWTSSDEFVSIAASGDYSGHVLTDVLKRDAVSGEIRKILVNAVVSTCSYSISTHLDKAACYRDDGLHILKISDGSDLNLLPIHDEFFRGWSPDDNTIVLSQYIKQDSTLLVKYRKAESGELVFSYKTYNPNYLPEWSPDGKWIATVIDDGQSRSLHVFNTNTYEEAATTAPGDRYIWSPDSQRLAVVRPNGVTFYEAQTGIVIKTVSAEGITALAWSPDGTMLAVGMDDGTIRVWDVADLQ